MFCYKCGKTLPDNAKFCSQCGTAQPSADTNTPTPAPAAPYTSATSYTSEPVKAGANVVYPDGHNEIGDLYITDTEIRFVKKSKAVRIAFGFLGSAIENGEEAFRLNVSDIAAGQRTRIGLNSNVYQITMINGDIFRFCMNQAKNIAVLERLIGNR